MSAPFAPQEDFDLAAFTSAANDGHPATMPDSLKGLGTFTVIEINNLRKRPRFFTGILTKPPVPVTGYGGWSRVARPRKVAITEWVGRDVLAIEIEFVIDDFATGRGVYVEAKCQILEELAGVESGDPEPPLLELHSNPDKLMPHGYARASQNRWFIESLTWDKENIRYNRAGNKIRAAGTIVVAVYSEDARLHPAAQKRAATKPTLTKGGSKRPYYTVLPGDTLHKIAARRDTYNDWKKWKLIAKANHIRTSKQLKHKIGKVLKLP